ncbi:hypothetical protein MVEN_00169800 [Mycena venus]|uniref:DUF6533 domain-containing protein n=1 Tax=Mycena venus TaxID=2733690 RepID=A0A8H6Z228_9AGAR|nr:hypothetical protein MVEN_00169800 [Mycena venus]
MDDDDWTPGYLGGEIILLNYLHLVGITLLYYDHLISMDKEINLIWRRRKSLSAYSFLLNRYFAFISGIPVSVIPVFVPNDGGENLVSNLEIINSSISLEVITAGIMIIRVYALYGRSQRVLWFMIGTGASVVAVSVWSVSGQQESRSMIIGGCHFGLTESTSYRFAGSWEGLFAFDSAIFGLTIAYAYSAHRLGVRHYNLPTVVVRDGAMYFGLMALSNLANIATYYLVEYWPFLPGALATFANCMSVTMISRLILNLHEHAHDGILTEPADSSVQFDHSPSPLSSVDEDVSMAEVDRDLILNRLRSLRSAIELQCTPKHLSVQNIPTKPTIQQRALNNHERSLKPISAPTMLTPHCNHPHRMARSASSSSPTYPTHARPENALTSKTSPCSSFSLRGARSPTNQHRLLPLSPTGAQFRFSSDESHGT